ncbi:MAG: methyltransferase domain-containing protein [Alphaproteobacteria bacterium]|nr:methyltransferase domain-containing protein [Alphaproteobacteria bacterium]
MTDDTLIRHYDGGQDLIARAHVLLREAGKDLDRLTIDDLVGLDEFHVRGREATLSLAQRLALRGGERVLDVGSGIGGPARRLATLAAVEVVGIDLTPAFVDLANEFSRLTGLADRVRFRAADALALPFADASFDVVWTQHVQMNIADKDRFCAEMFRVVRPGGRLALYDILQGPGGDVVYPTPWASVPELSRLATPAVYRASVERAGFAIESWDDVTEAASIWAAKRYASPPPPNAATVARLLGARNAAGAANIPRNLAERRIALVEAIARRPRAA